VRPTVATAMPNPGLLLSVQASEGVRFEFPGVRTYSARQQNPNPLDRACNDTA